MNSPRTTLYRDKNDGKFFGVCAGIADYTGIGVGWIRFAWVLSWFTPLSAVTVPGYFLAGFLLPKKPQELYLDREEQKYWQGVRQSPARTAREVRARFRDIDRRLANVEHYYVSNNPRLSAEIERLR